MLFAQNSRYACFHDCTYCLIKVLYGLHQLQLCYGHCATLLCRIYPKTWDPSVLLQAELVISLLPTCICILYLPCCRTVIISAADLLRWHSCMTAICMLTDTQACIPNMTPSTFLYEKAITTDSFLYVCNLFVCVDVSRVMACWVLPTCPFAMPSGQSCCWDLQAAHGRGKAWHPTTAAWGGLLQACAGAGNDYGDT